MPGEEPQHGLKIYFTVFVVAWLLLGLRLLGYYFVDLSYGPFDLISTLLLLGILPGFYFGFLIRDESYRRGILSICGISLGALLLISIHGEVAYGDLDLPDWQGRTFGLISFPNDSIDHLEKELRHNSMWLNGFSSIVELPATATPQEVLKKYMSNQVSGYNGEKIERYDIIKTKTVHIDWYLPSSTAFLVETNQGREIILLMGYEKSSGKWLARPYPVSP